MPTYSNGQIITSILHEDGTIIVKPGHPPVVESATQIKEASLSRIRVKAKMIPIQPVIDSSDIDACVLKRLRVKGTMKFLESVTDSCNVGECKLTRIRIKDVIINP